MATKSTTESTSTESSKESPTESSTESFEGWMAQSILSIPSERELVCEQLKQGDILHLPSGFVHSAHVQDLSSPSIHLSFGIEVDVAFRWEGLLHAIVRSHYTEIAAIRRMFET